eukprot:GHVT01059960.1.p1 GENE.GHVT01059960.1~~GHVT01059960.1.p1  ORF type:complete len:454 (+),score=104.22 GHVT01059960.1:369-1730(+)
MELPTKIGEDEEAVSKANAGADPSEWNYLCQGVDWPLPVDCCLRQSPILVDDRQAAAATEAACAAFDSSLKDKVPLPANALGVSPTSTPTSFTPTSSTPTATSSSTPTSTPPSSFPSSPTPSSAATSTPASAAAALASASGSKPKHISPWVGANSIYFKFTSPPLDCLIENTGKSIQVSALSSTNYPDVEGLRVGSSPPPSPTASPSFFSWFSALKSAAPSLGHVLVNSRPYEVLQFHFHAPAEHLLVPTVESLVDTFTQKTRPTEPRPSSMVLGPATEAQDAREVLRHQLELHVVCEDKNWNETRPSAGGGTLPASQFVVAGFTFCESSAQLPSPFLADLLAARRFPLTPGASTIWRPRDVEQAGVKAVGLASLAVDSGALFYRYQGSLTMPPCSENVTWFLRKDPLKASREQLAVMAALLAYPGTKGNFREVQNTQACAHNRETVYRVCGI